MKRIRIKAVRSTLPEQLGLTHISTSYLVATDVNFRNIILNVEKDTVNLQELRAELNISDNDNVYIKFKFHYTDNKESSWSRVITLKGSQKGLAFSDTIVATPKLSLSKDVLSDGTYTLKIETSNFSMFAGGGDHESSSWAIEDSDKKVIYSRSRDEDNLTSITINSSLLEQNKAYRITVVHHSSTKANSNAGSLIFTNYVNENSLFDIEQIGDLVLNRKLYFKLILKTIAFESVDIVIRNTDGDIVLSSLDQKTVTPYIFVKGLSLYETYKVFARIKLKGDVYSPYKLVSISELKDNYLVVPSATIKYLGKYDYIQSLMLDGLTAQSTSEFYQGSILLTKQDTNIISRYKLKNGKLVDCGKAITLPTTGKIPLPYINILPMHSGDVIVNYCEDTDGRDNAKSIFKYYSHNVASNRFKPIGSFIAGTEIMSTGLAASAVIDKNDNVYYIPYREKNDDGSDKPLALYMLTTSSMRNHKVAELPFTAHRAVSLAITSDNNLIVMGGCNNDTIYKDDNYEHLNRSNDDVYLFDTSKLLFSKIGDISSLPKTMYCFQSYLRRDGKVIAFNAVGKDASVGDQRTFIVDSHNSTVTVEDNDSKDNLVYRSTIVTRGGDILRISGREEDPQVVYRYVANTISAANIDENTEITDTIKHLVVKAGDIVAIEDPYLYDSIIIEGTSDEDTGYLKWVDGSDIKLYQYDDLIVTRDTTMTREEFNSMNYASVLVLDGVSFVVTSEEIPNELIVEEYETKVIFDPYQYTKITIKGTSMDNTGTLIWNDTYESRVYHFMDLIVTRPRKYTLSELDDAFYESITVLDNANMLITDQ